MIKVIVAGKRKAGMTRAQHHQHALEVHAELVKSCPSFWKYCHCYVQNHIVGQVNFETGEMFEADQGDYDVMSEFWFDSEADARKFWSSEEYHRILKPDEEKISDAGAPYLMLFVNEHLIAGASPLMHRSAGDEGRGVGLTS